MTETLYRQGILKIRYKYGRRHYVCLRLFFCLFCLKHTALSRNTQHCPETHSTVLKHTALFRNTQHCPKTHSTVLKYTALSCAVQTVLTGQPFCLKIRGASFGTEAEDSLFVLKTGDIFPHAEAAYSVFMLKIGLCFSVRMQQTAFLHTVTVPILWCAENSG